MKQIALLAALTLPSTSAFAQDAAQPAPVAQPVAQQAAQATAAPAAPGTQAASAALGAKAVTDTLLLAGGVLLGAVTIDQVIGDDDDDRPSSP